MEGSKATHLHRWARARGQGFIRFDYFGHGQSSGDFIDGTMSRWAADIEFVCTQLCEGSVILIGSSMGGWASLLAAISSPVRVAGLVLINPAPDFTEKLTVAGWTEAQIKALENDGVVYEPSGYDEPYAYSKALIDSVVPPAHSKRLMDVFQSKDVTYTLVQGGDHSLSRESDLKQIEAALTDIT